MAKITLDSKTFQALASSTRLTVLRALDERRKTLTELARDLQLNKATVHEHLQLLTGAGLVRKRDDEGRKWIYYELTWTGERLLHPQETTTFNVLLGLAAAAAGGGVFFLGQALGWWLAGGPPVLPQADEDAADQSEPSPAESPPSDVGAAGASQPSGTSPPSGAEGDTFNQAYANSPPASEPAPVDDPSSFLDDGGWMSIVFLLAATVFTVFALAIRRHIRPRRKAVPPPPPEEGEAPPTAPRPPPPS